MLSPFEDREEGHSYYSYDRQFRQEPVMGIYQMDGKLFQSVMGSEFVEITEKEMENIIAQYPRMDIEFKPASEFQENEMINQ